MVGNYTVEQMLEILSKETGFSRTRVAALCIQECFMSGVDLTLTETVLYDRMDIDKINKWTRRFDPHINR